jgi:hypothetical protein
MWPTIAIGIIAAFGYSLVQFGFVPPPQAILLIRIRSGQIKIRRGNLRPLAKDFVSEILQTAKISQGFIAVTSSHRVFFSRNIPQRVHQRLRNVLLNE